MGNISYEWQVDGSVICTSSVDPTRTATYAGPKGNSEQLAALAAFAALEPDQEVYDLLNMSLEAAKASAIEIINKTAGEFRSKFITVIPGQQATYLVKEQEAKTWTAEADPTSFPYCYSESVASGQTIEAVVTSILTTASQWRFLDAKIEGTRRGRIIAVSAATTNEEVYNAATIDWNVVIAS